MHMLKLLYFPVLNMMAATELEPRQLRKSTLLSRIQEQKANNVPVVKEKPQRNERGRRSLLKRRPVKGSSLGATSHVTQAATHRGQLYTIGDIVAVESEDDTLIYGQVGTLPIGTYLIYS